MADPFDEIRIRHVGRAPGNVWLAVHPFAVDRHWQMLDVGDIERTPLDGGAPMSEWLSALARDLWAEIPGMSLLSFHNGQIVLHHPQLFTDEEIIAALQAIIWPRLEQNLMLRRVGNGAADD